MWFNRMPLEEWFDAYQYRTRYDVGESAVKFLKLGDLGIDLNQVELRYGHHAGEPELRELIALEYEGLALEQTLVTSGGAEAIFSIAAALLKPGDHVIVEHPNYPSTYEVPRGLGCQVSLFKLKFSEGFRPALDRLQALITPRTKLIVLTHPNNPTGSMISTKTLKQLLAIAESQRIYVLFDETYRQLTFGPALPPAASVSPWAISVTSMSKSYGLPGIRIGWLATQSRAVLEGVLAVREPGYHNQCCFSEAIAIAALRRRDEFLLRARKHVATNLKIVEEWMAAQDHLEWVPPEGGAVCLPRIRDEVPTDPEALYRSLVLDHGVFVIPGRCFDIDNRFFRLGYGSTSQDLAAGLDKISAALAALGKQQASWSIP
jgi:aspartate/methionine/tyrosine aminotransferase